MAQQVDTSWTRDRIDTFIAILSTAGLLRDCGQAIYEIHPTLIGFLRSKTLVSAGSNQNQWSRSFALVMKRAATDVMDQALHMQTDAFTIHAANFEHARSEAERLEMPVVANAFVLAFANYAQNTWSYREAEKLWQQIAGSPVAKDRESLAVKAYHHMDIISRSRGDLDAAEHWYRKSLEISERLGNESNIAADHHALGMVAQSRNDLPTAEREYGESLKIAKRMGDDVGAVWTYHQMGIVAQIRDDLDGAERWYRKSLEIFERLGDSYSASRSYHQLGTVAQMRDDLVAAERWYAKALEIKESLGDYVSTRSTYHQLGMVAQARHDLESAERWYGKALAVADRLGDEVIAAGLYHQLGTVAQHRGDLGVAHQWFRKAMEVWIKTKNTENGATTQRLLDKLNFGHTSE